MGLVAEAGKPTEHGSQGHVVPHRPHRPPDCREEEDLGRGPLTPAARKSVEGRGRLGRGLRICSGR